MRSKVVILLTLVTLTIEAQTGKHFDADNMMSSSFTTQVFIDHDGFIWSATRNGLNRYDGYQYQIFKKEKNGQMGMASNYVNCMLQDRNGLFYIGMWGAIQTYDGQRFRNVKTHAVDGQVLPCYVTSLVERKNGDILVGTSGHGVMQMTDGENAHEIGGVLEPLKMVAKLMEDSKERLWIVTQDQGLWLYDGKGVKPFFSGETERASVLDVCEDHQGQIYVGTSNDGMFKWQNGRFEHIAATGSMHIAVLYVNRAGDIMMGCDGTGLAIYHPQTGLLEDNPFYSREVDLSKTKVYSIVEDLKGNYWLGLLQKGVYMQPASESGFSYMGYKLGAHNVIGTATVTSVLKSKNGYVWVGTDKDGLYCLTAEGKPIKHFKEHFPATILGMTEDGQGRVWTGSYKEGMGWIDTKTLTYHPHQLPQGPTVSVFGLEADRQGRLWIATMGQGLLRLDMNSGELKAYTSTEKSTLDRKVNRIVNDYISHLSLSPDGKRVYAATTMGVCAMNIETENWLETFGGVNCPNYGVPIRVVREFGHKLRIGTNDGLLCYDLKKHSMHKYGIESGLGDNGICSIEQDKNNNLWIATDHGLCCVDPKTKRVTNYYVDNGLQSNEFSNGASWTDPDGMMLFGGLGGITWFNPDDIRKSEWRAEVKLVDFKVNGESVIPGTMSGFWQVTDTTVIASNRFVLSPGDNSFALQLSTLTFDNPEHIVYRYRINDEEWVRLQPGVNEITFSHMSPGTYHFCVVAQRNDVTTPERCFTVIIHAPWYNTPLAYVIYVLAALGAIWNYLRLRRRKEQDHLRLQEHIHAEEMADAKLKFFMNISHEIRTPMTLIVTPLLSLIKQDDDSQRRSIYETMRRNAERILGLINQMMDLRKIDKGQMHMRMCETELISFVGDVYTLFAQQARAKNIKFSYDHNTEHLPVWIDRAHFDKVVVNILSNAFKFTPTGGQIHLGVTQMEGQVKITIKDSGEGIPKDKLDKVFERFYQSPSNVNDRNTGTGIGLDLTRSLVELHHGTIAVQNNSDGPGCEFTVTIPLGNAHLQADEMVTDKQDVSHNVSLLEEELVDEPVAESELPKGTRHLRIVVAEDDAEIREYLKTELSADYEVVACENGRVALSEIHKQLPHLVISDVMMPEMDGNTLCSKIKSNATTSHLPVILLTAKNRDEDMLEGLETGADSYIVKPFNMNVLKRTVANLIHNRQQLQLKYGRNDRLEEQVDDVVMQSPDDKLMARVMKAINQNLTNSDLSVDLIAQEVGISRVHLHRKMKELTGQTPHDFIRNLRMKQAAHLLASGNMNVTEVVYACGFGNVPSFSTTFKKYYGMTPREYMTEHNKSSESTHSAN